MSIEDRQKLLKDYTKEVKRLNDIVIETIIPMIITQVKQYVDYLKDASNPLRILDKPKNESTKGQKEYRSPTQIFFGGDF